LTRTHLAALALIAAFVLLVGLPLGAARAAIKTDPVTYKQGDTGLEGFIAYDDAATGKRPGIVVFPDWYGISAYAKARAEKLAQLGYVVFIADMYGKGIQPKNNEEAGAEVEKLLKNPALLQARYEAAFDQLRNNPMVDAKKLVATGYCFGGDSALGLARSGADLAATITFHGFLNNPDPATAKNIKGHVLVFWGANDPYVTAKTMAAFEDEMRATSVDWEVVAYANTVHSFTVPAANSKTDAYNPIADQRSWQQMQDFLHDVLR